MPKKSEPSFRLKEIIWDLAAITGAENLTALQKDLDYRLEKLRKDKNEYFFENTPDIRTIRRIIKLDIQRLPQDVVVAKLPPHVWRLRNDYQAIKQLAEGIKPEQEAPKGTTPDQRLTKHLDELAQTAETLAHHSQRLLPYKDDADVEVGGDVFGHLSFWRGGVKVTEGLDPVGEFTYEMEHPIEPYLAKLLYIHYEDKFGSLPFTEFSELSKLTVTNQIMENLKFLAHGGLEECPDCPVCKEIID